MPMRHQTIDEIDIKILNILVEDSSKTYKEIAEELGLDQRTVSARISKMKKMRIIEEMRADINSQRLWGVAALLVINLNFQEITPQEFYEMLMENVKPNRVRAVYEGFGAYDVFVMLMALDNKEMSQIITTIKEMKGVKNVEVTTLTKTMRHYHVVPDVEDFRKMRSYLISE